MTILTPARAGDLAACCGMIDAARIFQREQGFVQWTAAYPNADTLWHDIQAGSGYLVETDGRAAGYLCVDFGGEPAYRAIRGAWHTQEPYAVIHRMAFRPDFRGIGLADTVLGLTEALCLQNGVHAIRVDTDTANRRMQHILAKNGYAPCGVILFQGGEKLAFDKSFGAC